MSFPNIQPSRVRSAGAFLIAGFLMFLGIFTLLLFPEMRSSPPNWDFRGGTSAAQMIQAVAPYHAPWITVQIVTFISPILTAIGLILLTGILRETNARYLATIGLVTIVVATIIWTFHQYLYLGLTLGDPQRPSDLLPFIGVSSLAYQTQAAFEILTVVSALIYSVCLWRSGIQKWTGIVTTILGVLLLVGAIVGGGMPPIIPYFVTMLIGIGLIFRRHPIRTPDHSPSFVS